MTFELRGYQHEALDAIREAEERDIRRLMIVLATGAGKTVIFSHLPLVRPHSIPMLVLAHREELLNQAAEKIRTSNPDLVVEIEQGQKNYAGHVDVVVASVATLGRTNSARLRRFDPGYFRTVVVDEAHHAAATTYRRVLDYFSSALLLGVTATPRRGDKVRLDDIFDEIVYEKTMLDLIEEGWLAPPVAYRFETPVDLSTVKIVNGDYDIKALSAAINVDARHEVAYQAYMDPRCGSGTRKNLIFCVDIAQADAMAAYFCERGVNARSVHTRADDREGLLQQFRAGEFKVLTNVGIATEGYDDPSIDMITMARPTQSTVLFTQCIGRGARLYPGKENFILCDIADATKGRRPISLPSLLGLPTEFNLEGRDILEVTEAFGVLSKKSPSQALYVKSLDEIQGAFAKIDLFTPPPPNPALLEFTRLLWMEVGDTCVLRASDDVQVHITEDALGRYVVTADAGELPSPAGVYGTQAEAFGAADAWIREHFLDRVPLLSATAGWRNQMPSEKQIKVLRRHGIPWEHLTKGEASQILDKIFAENPRPQRPAWLERKIADSKTGPKRF